VTEIHNARNSINVLSSHVVIACGDRGPGTVSEVTLAMKARKPVILLGVSELSREFYSRLARENTHFATTAAEAVTSASRYKPTGKWNASRARAELILPAAGRGLVLAGSLIRKDSRASE
jgi:hypothetical protein